MNRCVVTEFWKVFVRVEPQDGCRIPTEMQCVRGVAHTLDLQLDGPVRS